MTLFESGHEKLVCCCSSTSHPASSFDHVWPNHIGYGIKRDLSVRISSYQFEVYVEKFVKILRLSLIECTGSQVFDVLTGPNTFHSVVVLGWKLSLHDLDKPWTRSSGFNSSEIRF